MPKVLLIVPVSEIGGGETVLLNLVRFRERSDFEYHALIVSDMDGPLGKKFEEYGVPSARVPRGRMGNPLALLSALSAIRREIQRLAPDVVIANSSQGFLYARWAAGGRRPMALYFMSMPQPVLWRNNPLDVLARLSPPAAIFAASQAIGRALESCGFKHVSTVYHGAPEPIVIPEQRVALDRRLLTMGIPANAPLVLMPGRLQRWKGQLVFVRAFAALAREFPNAHAVCLGEALFGRDADFRDELKSEIQRLSLEGRMHMPGHDTIAPWLQRAACVVHASTEPDAFPNVCIEALASHRALITNSACGVAEILTPGQDAWVLPPSDVGALSAAIGEVMSNPAAATLVAAAGYRRYLEHCTPPQMVRPIEQRLAELARH